MRWAQHVTHIVEIWNLYQILGRKPEGNRPLRTPRHWWEDSSRRNLRETGWEIVGWIHLA